MHTDIQTRVEEILDQYSAQHADVAWLLCDRHPVERVALTVIDERLNSTALSYGDLGDIFKTCGAGLFQATSVSVDSLGSAGVMSTGRSSSLPDRKILR